MSHVRAQIRAQVASILSTSMVGYRVFTSRKYRINESELPCIDVRFGNENSQVTSMGGIKDREAALYIRVTDSGTSEDIDDDLDAACVVIEQEIEGAFKTNGLAELVKYCSHAQTNFSDNPAEGTPLAEVILRFDIGYRTSKTDPETARK